MDSTEILFPSPSPSPKKKQRCEGPPQPPSEIEDPKSKTEVWAYDDDSDDAITDKEFEEYSRQIRESDGFHCDVAFPRNILFIGILPILRLDQFAEVLNRCSQLALQKYNQDENKNLEFVKVVKANKEVVAGAIYYITFEVKDPDAVDGSTVEFQAKVWSGITNTSVDFCRPKPN